MTAEEGVPGGGGSLPSKFRCRNRGAENLYGYSAAEALGRHLLELIVDPSDTTIAQNIVHLVFQGESWAGQFPMSTKSGDRLTVVVGTIGRCGIPGLVGTVYHVPCGMDQYVLLLLPLFIDVAVKVFSKQEYSDSVILSFRQEVSLTKRLRHPNVMLFMGAMSSPRRFCIITEFQLRGKFVSVTPTKHSKTRVGMESEHGIGYCK
ncbi:unnamed protein product [Linum tenue]|uniref:PAS domain-containing protein n=1 Tax=Linum tenue TaxID=586396 RepID=A0AAV0S081_9ROSI|nr:unnamed protein product [Linum tenue]